ncbi:ASTRA-associated protein 1 [Taphrina deformans PYCC 5710]|uniref:ASTRA-associated protein 1 n=1 Tax=Taphrina deformans (strain PYCC 5710 / ATCC 11124 / CBS 356.35 / IMI 108563 / JCM 9778 / NBRC 8474) TaxID=1097556 RepID=R4X9Z5_TAPDE|nr:ASTRA-associated protein 1 [Taphrina deformans PYCC 5710]|eukprot:CCG81074.1 ASTRA-associated protein 1 [Taphrina deformans PYCC 5710]
MASATSTHTSSPKVLLSGDADGDNKIHMWEVLDIDNMDKSLPLPTPSDDKSTIEPPYRLPFMICSLDVNSLNFCQASFSRNIISCSGQDELLLAVPGLIGNDHIDLYSLPSAHRLATRIIAPAPAKGKLGNVMAVDLQYPLLCVGYENGAVAIFELNLEMVDRSLQKQDGKWDCMAIWHAHRDAVLSVTLNTTTSEIYSCGIDSRLIRYTFDTTRARLDSRDSYHVIETRHSGQQSMRMRSDQKLLGTAGWDSYARIYTTSKLKQVAVLGFHKAAINAIDFQEKTDQGEEGVVALGSKDAKISLWKLY